MSTELGGAAEHLAADWLKSQGFKVVVQNWRNRWSEIDIIATKEHTIHFVEVKYRKSENFGSGLEYITKDKQSRLRRASLAWLVENHQEDDQYQIDVITVTGQITPENIEYLPYAVHGSGML